MSAADERARLQAHVERLTASLLETRYALEWHYNNGAGYANDPTGLRRKADERALLNSRAALSNSTASIREAYDGR